MTHGAYRFRGGDGALTILRKTGLQGFCAFCLCCLLAAGCSHNAVNPSGASGAEKQGHLAHRAVIGGLADTPVGDLIARYMDGQAKELAQIAATQRIDDGIIVTLDNKLLFDLNSAKLKANSRDVLRKMAAILKKYDKTNLTVAGHTDNLGPTDYKIQLSERRAKAVADALAALGITPGRVRIIGFGYERPMSGNDTEEGRAKNRRVEIHISPSETLRREDQPKQG